MDNMGLWVSAIVVLFILGSIFSFRTSPRDKALANLREKARKLGLNPRLVPAPEWLGLEKQGNYAPMVAYYSVMIKDGRLALMRAKVQNQQLHVVVGDERWQHHAFQVVGAYAVEMQANAVSVYWDESQDLKAEHLEQMKQALLTLSQTEL
ncbi:MAG: ammonium transporter [Acinetobacter sp.]|nr:ammonium transporter [Acinetobacter sp.]